MRIYGWICGRSDKNECWSLGRRLDIDHNRITRLACSGHHKKIFRFDGYQAAVYSWDTWWKFMLVIRKVVTSGQTTIGLQMCLAWILMGVATSLKLYLPWSMMIMMIMMTKDKVANLFQQHRMERHIEQQEHRTCNIEIHKNLSESKSLIGLRWIKSFSYYLPKTYPSSGGP